MSDYFREWQDVFDQLKASRPDLDHQTIVGMVPSFMTGGGNTQLTPYGDASLRGLPADTGPLSPIPNARPSDPVMLQRGPAEAEIPNGRPIGPQFPPQAAAALMPALAPSLGAGLPQQGSSGDRFGIQRRTLLNPPLSALGRQQVAQTSASARNDLLRAAQAAQEVQRARAGVPTSWGMNRGTPQQDINMERAAAALNPLARAARVVRRGAPEQQGVDPARLAMARQNLADRTAERLPFAGMQAVRPDYAAIQFNSKANREAKRTERMQANAQQMMASANPRVQARGYALADALATKGQGMASFTQPGQADVDLVGLAQQATRIGMRYGRDAGKAFFESSVAAAMAQAKQKSEMGMLDKEMALKERMNSENNQTQKYVADRGAERGNGKQEMFNLFGGRFIANLQQLTGGLPATPEQLRQAEEMTRKQFEEENRPKDLPPGGDFPRQVPFVAPPVVRQNPAQQIGSVVGRGIQALAPPPPRVAPATPWDQMYQGLGTFGVGQ